MIKSVLDYLEKTTDLYPNKIAYTDPNNDLSFSELRKSARAIGTFVSEKQGINKPVLIIMEKGAMNLPAFFGAVYAGDFYVPIDCQMPTDRIRMIVDKLHPEIVVYDKKAKTVIDELGLEKCSYLVEDILQTEINEKRLRYIDQWRKTTDLLYVLFTSGSTGIPKGVTISHNAVIDFIEWITWKYEISDKTRLCNQAPFYFDASVPDIFIPIKTGATLYIPPKSYYTFPKKVLQYIEKNQIDTIIWVPSALCNVVNANAFEVCIPSTIDLVIFCGEVMPCKKLNVWMKYIPDALYVNMYGPTEATYACTYFNIERIFKDSDVLPLGRPCENSEILLLNENGTETRDGEIGELCILGECLSDGYYDDWERSNEVFIQNPVNKLWNERMYRTGDLAYKDHDGILIFAGRKDFQIKKLGHRIELGEIENAIMAISEVKNTCCLYNSSKEEIIAVIAGNIERKMVHDAIAKSVPSYMLPDKYEIIDELPMNINGKIDRAKLKKMYAED